MAKKEWVNILRPQLKGKAQHVFVHVSEEVASDYVKLEEQLVLSFSYVPEVYREKFRSIKKDNTVTFKEFAFRLEISFKRLIHSLNATKFEKLKQVVLIEQYMSCLPDDIRIWLLDRNPTTLSDAAKLSDEYTAVHKNHASLLSKTSFTAVTGHSNTNRYNSNRRYQGYHRSGRFGFNSTRSA